MYEVFELVNKMSPYLLLGFLFAGVMHAFVPSRLYRDYLSGNDFASVLRAALLGIPLPLCSCGVIPTAMSLRREGASKGATVSFLIATPQTGVDSILATYSLMGLPFAMLRPVVSLLTALMGGMLVNLFGKNNNIKFDGDGRKDRNGRVAMSFWERVKSALHYGFVELVQDIGKWLLVGLFIAGLITVFVPESFFSVFSDYPLLSYLLVLAFSVPMYLCATGSIPIAVALMLKGLSPGTALVLLMAGPASSMASVFVINKVLGRRTLILYLAAIVCGAVSAALFVDYLLPREWFVFSSKSMDVCCEPSVSYFGVACTVLLLLLLVNAFVRRRIGGGHEHMGDAANVASEPLLRFAIEGMRCNHCRGNVEKAIASLSGVSEVIVELEGGVAVVKGDIAAADVIAAVDSLGFKASVID